jgi:hypothetical protein
MADKPDAPAANNEYQSTPEDRRRAQLLGVVYVILAIFLAWMLFKIWPPTPWPTSKELAQNPQLARELRDAECPTASPSPSASPTPSPQQSVTPSTMTSQTSGQSSRATPTTTPSAGSTVSRVPTPNPGAPPTGGAGTQTGSQGGGTASSPSPSPSATPTPSDMLINLPINFFWGLWCYRTSFDERLILLVIIAGMLGSFVHGATSLADFIGNNKFNKNWTWFYLLRPAIGMALALVFYFVVRGGFLTTSGGAKDINPYGIAALAGMVGMFSKQATDKLSEVFGTLFRSKPGEGDDKRSGPLKPDAKAITITDVDPKGLVAANSANQTIKVTGTNFVNGSKVILEQTTPPATITPATTFVSASELSAKLGSQNLSPQTYKLKVVNPDNAESPKVDFVVR